ncbi:hypothetical protein D9M71_838560 [compost metagenome]
MSRHTPPFVSLKTPETTVVSIPDCRTGTYMLRQVLDNKATLSNLVVTFANTAYFPACIHCITNQPV